jgi:hypothetical protein
VTGLATLQDAIQTLSSAYIKHTNAILGEHGAGLDVDSALSRLSDNPLLGGPGFSLPHPTDVTATPAPPAGPPGKPEKKKRVQDPNAPKRPLTPYFLYMQTARPIIADELGPDVPRGAVSEEGVKRWNEMAQPDKELWTNVYKDNMKLYHARVHSYKAGNLQAKDMTDEEAQAYADSHNIEVPAGDVAVVAEPVDVSAAPAAAAPPAVEQHVVPTVEASPEPEAEEEPASPPKATPKGKPSRAKKGKATPDAGNTSAIIPPPSAAKSDKAASPDKKRKRASRKDDLVAEAPVEETPKSTKSRKAKKSRGD